jgi:hypothetical protein
MVYEEVIIVTATTVNELLTILKDERIPYELL